jgi:hypothetical protein
MAWLWHSWQEYVEAVHPSLADRPGLWRQSHRQSRLETVRHLLEAVSELTEAQRDLSELGYSGNDDQRPPHDSKTINMAKRLVTKAIYAGEMLLLYHRRLAESDASYGFLHQNELLKHWDRYEQTGRIAGEIQQLSADISELLQGYQHLLKTEERFIIGRLELPAELEADFQTARHLFSIGFDEVGLLIARRGLEGVLLKIAHARKIAIEVKGKISPAHETDFYDLIEAMYHIRWKVKGGRLIDNETRSLLHYLRTLRNAGAHPRFVRTRSGGNCRETAIVIADTANLLWTQASSRAKLQPRVLQKTW